MDCIEKSYNIINKYELLKFANKITGSLIDEIDPIFKLINNFSEINSLIINNSDKFRYIYFHKKKVKLILYECEKEIIIDSDKIENTLDKLFYLSLLVTENKEIINYKYSIDYIMQLDESNENNNLELTKMIFSKIILDLIEYYKGFEEYNESIEQSIVTIKNKNIDIIKNNSHFLIEFNLDYKDFINKSIEEIYFDIIKTFLYGNKDYKYILNVINQMNLEKIDITNFIFKEISKFISNEINIIPKTIININDLLNIDKIEFYYILLKYILKNSYYIYQIPFLKDTRTFILKNIKFIKYDTIDKEKIEKLEYLIDTLTGSKYYFEQFGTQNDSSIIFNDTSEGDKNMNENSKKVSYKSNKSNTKIIDTRMPKKNDKDIETNQNKMSHLLEKISNILEEIIINYQNNKYDKKILINCLKEKERILIEYDELIELKKDINFYDMNKEEFLKYASFVKLLNFIQKTDEFISKKYRDKNFGIILKLERVKSYEKQNKNGIYNITCKYGFYSHEKGLTLNYIDENILLNGNNKGFHSLICDLNEFL